MKKLNSSLVDFFILLIAPELSCLIGGNSIHQLSEGCPYFFPKKMKAIHPER